MTRHGLRGEGCRINSALILSASLLFYLGLNASAEEKNANFILKQKSYGGGAAFVKMVANNQTMQMHLDTGASATYVLPAAWNRNFPILGTRLANGANGKSAYCDKIDLTDLKLITNAETPRPNKVIHALRCRDNNGENILGIDFLYGQKIGIDFREKVMTIKDDASPAPEFSQFISIKGGDGILGLPIKIGGIDSLGLFDTGAEICAVDSKFVDAHKDNFTLVSKSGYATEGGGYKVATTLYKIKFLAIGNTKALTDVFAVAYDFTNLQSVFGKNLTLIIGYNAISKYKWDLDLRSSPALWKAM